MSAVGASERARGRVREAGGDELVERLEHLDRARGERLAKRRVPEAPRRAPDAGSSPEVDVAIAGGGLSLLLAPLLAARGLRVAVLDRAKVGQAHREWNAGEAELSALAGSGLCSRKEVDALVVARYARGLCRWYGGGSYPVTGVLDHAIDAGSLLSLARRKAEALGVLLLDRHALVAHAEGKGGVTLALEGGGAGRRALSARVLVDARGASSENASADLVCPTVGGVMAGLAEQRPLAEAPDEPSDPYAVRRDEGDILATTEDVEEGKQHVWEAFPGRPGEVTVYLFHYAMAEDPRASLLPLYARFFDLLPRYKRGSARLVRPTFGFIPGWSRLCPAPRAPGRRVLLVGDAASRHSPLTFCGFGHALRGLARTADAVARAAAEDDPEGGARLLEACDAPIHAGTGALARMMARPAGAPGDLNALLDTAFGTLFEMGDEVYGRLLRDEMSAAEFVRFLKRTADKRPRVYADVFRTQGPRAVARWGLRVARAWATSR